jgi:hypothetical protein
MFNLCKRARGHEFVFCLAGKKSEAGPRLGGEGATKVSPLEFTALAERHSIPDPQGAVDWKRV